MSDPLELAVESLVEQCRTGLARQITYRRGEKSASIAAVVGQTTFDQTNEYGVVTSTTSRDFLIAVSDLLLDGQPIEPARGDQIDDSGRTYEVMAPGDEPHWRFADPYRLIYRVHTKEIT